jgi:hypothetical protein
MSAHGLCDQRFWLAAAGALLVGALPPSMLLVLRLASAGDPRNQLANSPAEREDVSGRNVLDAD